MSEPCNCIDLGEEAFVREGTNTRLRHSTNFKTGLRRMIVATEKRDTRNREKALLLFATFCPLCGERYEPEGEEEP